jgi:hypothetical protein
MFGFVQWDSPLALLLEILLSVAVIVVVMWLARFTAARSPETQVPGPEPEPGDSALGAHDSSQPGQES